MTEQNSSEQAKNQDNQLDQAVAEGGAYEVIRARLVEQAAQLKQKVDHLNQARVAEFGQAKLDVLSRVRVRTENNCVSRDIVPVGDSILFGYNVFIGLKKETKVQDVFGLYQLKQEGDSFELVAQDIAGTFLADATFTKEFNELYVYYKEARLIQLKVQNQILFAVFQIGRKIDDTRVFQWRLNTKEHKDGAASYIDNRGERALKTPQSHDFEWQKIGREQHESGAHPHANILDKVFVETIGGQLTIKVENNTEDGLGIYNEPVEDQNQSLADADIQYAQIGSLILLKIQPYREKEYRFLVFNTRTNQVDRIDAIGLACISLPEDHGIIFPGGYYLQNGETKSFPDEIEGLRFKRSIRSPNGEDVLYVFYEPESGLVGLYSYNLIRKELQNPIYAHGYSVFEDGTMVVFVAEDEATRVHPMQIWETPYFSNEHAAKQPTSDSFYSRIGNKELVRGISDLIAINKTVVNPNPSRNLYEDLIKTCRSMFDSYYWLAEPEVDGLGDIVKQITSTSELVIDEFVKVEQIRLQADTALQKAVEKQKRVIDSIKITDWQSPEQFVECLNDLRKQRGHLITLKNQRYINLERISQLDAQVTEQYDLVSSATVEFLAKDQALQAYHHKITTLENALDAVTLVVDIKPLIEELNNLSLGLDLLTEILNGLKVEDATIRTKILEDISQIYSKLNQVKAQGRKRSKELGSGEATAEFAAQFRLFSQSINSALVMADTPDKADEQLSRLMIQLEELESKFSEHDQFLADILEKREELHSVFENRKQGLLEDQQRRSQNIFSAAERILKGISRRANSFTEPDELNTYFASDPMVLKIADLVVQLRGLNDPIKADDLEAQLKAAKEQGIRSLRDKQDIFEDGGSVIKLGKHKFSVNSQNLDLTLLPRDEGLYRHLIGTDYFELIQNQELTELKPYWQQALVSESDEVSRVEYLSSLIVRDAEQQNGLSTDKLYSLKDNPVELSNIVRKYMAQRYQEGYEKGVHDSDVVNILQGILPVHQKADLLRFSPNIRAIAKLYWAFGHRAKNQEKIWKSHAFSAHLLANSFNSPNGFVQLRETLSKEISAFTRLFALPFESRDITQASEYLSLELAQPKLAFISSKPAKQLADSFVSKLDNLGHGHEFQAAMAQFNQLLELAKTSQDKNSLPTKEPDKIIQGLEEQWTLANAWLEAMLIDLANDKSESTQLSHYVTEAAALIIVQDRIDLRPSKVDLNITIDGLLSDHKNIVDSQLSIALDEFSKRLNEYHELHVPNFVRYHKLRQQHMQISKQELQLDSYKAKPLSSFVRNRLINEVYLPIIGDNLAKQMGTVGENKRTDLMGLLLLISPPGYGKTTLMEYVADRLGLVFMKINCPSLGHDVTSIDPENAPNATAKQELEKLNLGLEMGSNVMLYLDDIQHTHPEFLQKFISLCDGTRRIEGVWKGQSKTYDMRGKKFCVVMAGNPYTESGDVFKVPDMLANRADIYNLGDVLGGKEQQFALSYIENALTSNPVLAPLALRDMQDVYKLVTMAQEGTTSSSNLSHQYSGAEVNEITSVLRHLLVIQDVILKVNLEYIKSAATAEDYREEPPFKLQGSYRNMNKMAEKVSAVMNHDELIQLIGDHYTGEAQTLTSGAEENLLKLAMLRGAMDEQKTARWQHICSAFGSKQSLNLEGDPTTQAVQQLGQMANSLEAIKLDMQQSDTSDLIRPINRVATAMHLLSKVWSGAEEVKLKKP
ncbi:DNA repair ATPase [Paraglaciecola aquimarina]|uniref:DNA repair ATPase n=1 Tax=Paraglaciecola algarum TaxID=3050085 RepID=A0ABS9D522_9ALTE|nr:DNA repair ATPase [Paraglaciecola sp. G1-23]MCF2947107.1 DNA repair ATPase [Paraglaciecola sp. G1-23]